jgi:transcription elongation factor Elf1
MGKKKKQKRKTKQFKRKEIEASVTSFSRSHTSTSKQQLAKGVDLEELQCLVHGRAKQHPGSPSADVEYLYL